MKRDLKYDKRMRMWARILFFVITLLTPIVMISYKYDYYRSVNGYSITFTGIIMIVIIFQRFRVELIEWINQWEYSAFKHILLGLNRVIVPIFIYAIVLLAKRGVEDLMFVVEWVTLTTIIGYLIVLPIEKHYDFHVKRELRKKEMREVKNE